MVKVIKVNNRVLLLRILVEHAFVFMASVASEAGDV